MGTGSEDAPHRLGVEGHADRGRRPAQPEPFLRGAPWPGTRSTWYPRADPADRTRIPGDTWQMAAIPVGVRLEVTGSARAARVTYRCGNDQLGYRGQGAGTSFASWTASGRFASVPAVLVGGDADPAVVEVPLDPTAERTVVHLPEGMLPTILEVVGVDGDLSPAAPQPRWVVYGDSVAEGWIASEPGLAWPAIAGREQGLDHVNLGYAGAARGETASAEQVAGLVADVITVCHGTNCWTRTPHSVDQMRANTTAFLDVLRQRHPRTPVVVASPVVRPDAEATPNRLGATLADLRRAMEEAVAARSGDQRLHLVRGLDVLDASLLGDGIHPDDDGHRRMAAVLGAAARAALDHAGVR